MKRLLISLLIIICASGTLSAARKALVIGNAEYGSRTLKNPVNDAADLAGALQELGFATTLIKNADYAAMYRGIESFTEALVNADEVVFYFSGHGVQIADTNYLIPVGDRKLSDKIDYDTYAISATWALGKLARAKVSVMILDACRDNPTLTRSVSAKKGLAKLEPESGSQYVIYATEKDTEAFDGEGRNSPFATSLLKHIKSPVRVGDDLMRLIRSDVRQATDGQQVPTAYGILDDPFFLALPKAPQDDPVSTANTDDSSQGVDGLIAELGKLRESRMQSEASWNDLRDYIRDVDNSTREDSTPPGMVYVEGGSFMMGSNDGDADEKPVHKVTVSSFYMGKYEVTQKEWRDLMGTNPAYFKGDNRPVEQVSWYEMVVYCNERSITEGFKPCYYSEDGQALRSTFLSYDSYEMTVISVDWEANGYRLPTEAEWEYAARGGSKSKGYRFSGSDDLGSVAWYRENSGGVTHPVGTKLANELGIHDMLGNVDEWCWDGYDYRYYSQGERINPAGNDIHGTRVVRGDCYDGVLPYITVSNREYDLDPGSGVEYVGLRVVRSVK